MRSSSVQVSSISREQELLLQDAFIRQGRMRRISHTETIAEINRQIDKIKKSEIKIPDWVIVL